jgi:hypothetical protein
MGKGCTGNGATTSYQTLACMLPTQRVAAPCKLPQRGPSKMCIVVFITNMSAQALPPHLRLSQKDSARNWRGKEEINMYMINLLESISI